MGRRSIRRYWQPDLERRIRYRDPRDYLEAGREMLDRVVAPSLRAIGPVACQLSGGLDSSGVAATAACLLDPTRLHTFTAVPEAAAPMPAERPRAFYDEAALASDALAARASARPSLGWETGTHTLTIDIRCVSCRQRTCVPV